MIHEPHVFRPSTNPRSRSCMKCGRVRDWHWHVQPALPPPRGSYTRDEVLRMIAAVRHQSVDTPDARGWAEAMLQQYDSE